MAENIEELKKELQEVLAQLLAGTIDRVTARKKAKEADKVIALVIKQLAETQKRGEKLDIPSLDLTEFRNI